jgi:hypothetical protein
MSSRRLQIVDSLLELDTDSHEADTIRLRRAHLARYAKMAMAGAFAICFVAGVRVALEAMVGEPDAATETGEAPSGAATSARPQPTPAAEVLPSATQRVQPVATTARPRRSHARGR